MCTLRSFAILGLAAAMVSGMAQYRNDRPIRGTWLRPDGSTTNLENHLKNFAKSGITDLYLETFYHGISTGKAGVFNARFGTDHLAAAIPLAAKYGIRLHAWVEAGYWQYGTTGAYNFTGNPDWKVINVSTGLEGGDIAQQVFANLCHPGVQAKLKAYTSELASSYNGLWGVQTDYHRFPVDNASDNFPTPWTYDTWSQTAFSTSIGTSVNLSTQAARTSHTYYNQYLQWRRDGITEAARQMALGIRDVSTDVSFSGAVFPATASNSAQIAKCQEWTKWCSNGTLDYAVPMCYSTTLTGIGNEINTAKTVAVGTRVVPGLAVTGSGTKPALTDQLVTAKARSIEDFIVWEGTYFGTAANQSDLLNWLSANATPMRADLDSDGLVSLSDYRLFLATYQGASVASNAGNRMNFDGDSDIDTNDHKAFRLALAKFRLGDFGVYSTRRAAAITSALGAVGGAVGTPANHLFDVDESGAVTTLDRDWMERTAQTTPVAFVDLDLQNSTVGPEGRTVTFEWRTDTGTPIRSWTVPIETVGNTPIPSPGIGTYQLSIRFEHWLRRTVTLAFGSSDQAAVPVSLVNGDANGDNAIDLLDYFRLSDAYNSVKPDSLYDSMVDFNEDDSVDLLDYFILSDGYGLVGDE